MGPVVDNFVASEEQIIMLKTGSKSVQNWRRYNRLKFGALRKRVSRNAPVHTARMYGNYLSMSLLQAQNSVAGS